MESHIKLASIGLLATSLLCTRVEGFSQRYNLHDLGPLDQRNRPINATAISPDGSTIVGYDSPNGYLRALQFAPTFQVIRNGFSDATDVEEGKVVGYVYYAGTYLFHAVVWQDGTMRVLPQPQNSESARATCVNAPGDVWGDIDAKPVEWVDEEVLIELPTLGGRRGSVNACDDGGNSAGWSLTSQNEAHCTWWSASGETLDCHPYHGTNDSRAVAMNNQGLIAGTAIQYGRSFGYLWQWFKTWWLMPLPSDSTSTASALNEGGDAVGRSCNGALCHAVGWEQQHPIELLPRVSNGEGWSLSEASAISDEGDIVALGIHNNDTHVVLLTPENSPTESWFAWKSRIYNWYIKQYWLHQRRAR